MATSHDLILRGGRVVDPSTGQDGPADVAFSDGRVAAVGPSLREGPGTDVRNVAGAIVTPGLIDLHTHVYWGGTSLGVDAERFARTSGVTTFVDTGSAGAGNFAGFRSHVIERSPVRILAFLHISYAGIFGYTPSVSVGESENIRLMAPKEAVAVADDNRDLIVGIKVRVGRNASGSSGIDPLNAAIDTAREAGLPVMAHIDHPPPSYEEVLARLRPGDILTHAFRPFPNSPLIAGARIRDEIAAARERGVLFDIGHGKGSFSFAVAEKLLEAGFRPDTISSDIHAFCVGGPVFDQTTTLSKFLALGMSLSDVVAATTMRPARAIGRPELGSFAPGSVGDATVLSLEEGRFEFEDAVGRVLTGTRRLVARGVVLGGAWWHTAT
mgnify:CR=1 FL=1